MPLTLALKTPPIPADRNIRNGFPSTLSSTSVELVIELEVSNDNLSTRFDPLSTNVIYASLAAGVILSIISPIDSVSSLKFRLSLFGEDLEVENLNENFLLFGEFGVFGESLSFPLSINSSDFQIN